MDDLKTYRRTRLLLLSAVIVIVVSAFTPLVIRASIWKSFSTESHSRPQHAPKPGCPYGYHPTVWRRWCVDTTCCTDDRETECTTEGCTTNGCSNGCAVTPATQPMLPTPSPEPNVEVLPQVPAGQPNFPTPLEFPPAPEEQRKELPKGANAIPHFPGTIEPTGFRRSTEVRMPPMGMGFGHSVQHYPTQPQTHVPVQAAPIAPSQQVPFSYGHGLSAPVQSQRKAVRLTVPDFVPTTTPVFPAVTVPSTRTRR